MGEWEHSPMPYVNNIATVMLRMLLTSSSIPQYLPYRHSQVLIIK